MGSGGMVGLGEPWPGDLDEVERRYWLAIDKAVDADDAYMLWQGLTNYRLIRKLLRAL